MENYEQNNQAYEQNQEEPGIRYFEPFPVAPLKVSGIFGIGWQLYRRSFGAAFLLTLVLMGIVCVLMGLVAAPIMDWTMQMTQDVMYYGESAIMNGFGQVLLLFPVMMLLSLLTIFLLQPMYTGTMYQEMHDRAEGRAKSVGRLFKSVGAGLKKVYTTMLVMMLMMFGLSFVAGIVASVMMVGAMVSGAASGGFSGAFGERFIGTIIVLYVIVLVLAIVFSVFLMLMYPVNAAENKRGFKALGRGFKLAGKRFWRCLGVLLLLTLIELVLLAVCYIPGIAIMLGENASFGTGYALLFLGAGIASCLMAPYNTAVLTALYRDCAARVPEVAAPIDTSSFAVTLPVGDMSEEVQPEAPADEEHREGE